MNSIIITAIESCFNVIKHLEEENVMPAVTEYNGYATPVNLQLVI